ncbi:MAG: tRNA pseudouridine(38-40) synthase TruA [Flavobacteriales bacterium]|nr:tRNA pseudouridine(38-40) synthase TruA [Flavobacteriales bacterium]
MPRYFLEISFNGTAYRGWQVQPDRPTVQAELERALRMKLRDPRLGVVGCGRTDTGVHATQFFVHFDQGSAIMPEPLAHGLNSFLPDDIAVLRCIPVPPDAHARFSATERRYLYRIHRHKDPFLTDRSHLLRPALDINAMNSAVSCLVGVQDFSSFCKAGTDAKTMICDVREAIWRSIDNGYEFRISADRFLRNMVRAIVGTCIRIGKGQWPVERMQAILAARDRALAGKSAAARGLYLIGVDYPFVPAEVHDP